ncbi:hypothetical protein FHT26_000707 [Rhizobacter sp. SG703]|nr:hypothetical protein [Rhizobacter sp. SG703]
MNFAFFGNGSAVGRFGFAFGAAAGWVAMKSFRNRMPIRDV